MDVERKILAELDTVCQELRELPQRTVGDYFTCSTPDDEQQRGALQRWASIQIHEFALKIVTEGMTHRLEADLECLQSLQREHGNLLYAVVDIYNVAAVRVASDMPPSSSIVRSYP